MRKIFKNYIIFFSSSSYKLLLRERNSLGMHSLYANLISSNVYFVKFNVVSYINGWKSPCSILYIAYFVLVSNSSIEDSGELKGNISFNSL